MAFGTVRVGWTYGLMLSRILSLSACLMLLRILPILMTLIEARWARLIVARFGIAFGMISLELACCETEANAESVPSLSFASFDSKRLGDPDVLEEASTDSTFGWIRQFPGYSREGDDGFGELVL